MKVKSLALALLLFFMIWIFIPSFLIYLNIAWSLEIYTSTFGLILGVFLLIFALIMAFHTFFFFYKIGHGTPVPVEPPKKFVVRGLYKYTRNPMYWGYMASFLAYFLIFGHFLLLLYFIFSFLAINVYIYFEERLLRKRFGKEYIDYCQNIPRWGIKLSQLLKDYGAHKRTIK